MTNPARLAELYGRISKHSNYQVLAPRVEALLAGIELETHSRWERERLEFIRGAIDFSVDAVLDIGGNSGFFSFEALELGARRVHYYEGNPDHCEFVATAAGLLGYGDRLQVHSEYFDFSSTPPEPVQVALLLNVLHHVGDDYGAGVDSVAIAREVMVKQLNVLADSVEHLVLQIGFCWKGDTRKLLFKEGIKAEMIDFVAAATAGFWDIQRIGIPEKRGESVVYAQPSENNLKRDDSLGEFLNRPLFILKAC